jgi:purine catabolism regulator
VLRRALPEVLAGEHNLGRAVRWVHVVDVPEPDELLRGGELVLSTGLGPGHDRLAQKRFIRSLAAQRAAGLVIEVGYTYKHELPRGLVAEAEAAELPLIATHRPTRFVDITEAIHGALVDRRLALLRRAQEAGDRMTSVVLERGDLGALLSELARSLENPVALENIAGQLVGFASFQAGERELLEAHMEYLRARQPGQLEGPGWLAVEIASGGRQWGQVTALEIDSPLLAEDRMVLERGAQALELVLLHEQHDEQLRARARGSFLAELMRGRLQEADAARRAVALDFHPGNRHHLLAGALGWRSERWTSIADTPEEAWAALMPAVRNGASDGRPALLGLDGGTLLLIVAIGEAAPSAELLGSLAEELRAPLRRRELSEADVAIAFGGSESSWTGVGRKLDRAANAVMAARATSPSPWRDARHGSLVDLLYTLRRSPELLTFARDQLGPLFEERDQRSRELLRTLETYLAASGRKAETARALHLTRQSLYLRLERLQRALDVDLDDPDVLLALHLALRALRVTQILSPDQRL